MKQQEAVLLRLKMYQKYFGLWKQKVCFSFYILNWQIDQDESRQLKAGGKNDLNLFHLILRLLILCRGEGSVGDLWSAELLGSIVDEECFLSLTVY